MTKASLRKLWLQIHKWIGISLAIVFAPLAFSGSMLVWHDALDNALNPQRKISGDGRASKPASEYLADLQRHIDKAQTITSMRFEDGRAMLATATDMTVPESPYQPLNRTSLWLDPADGQLLDMRDRNSGFVQTMERLHGSLFIPMYGRPVIGFLGLAMLLSCASGLWLWWPISGSFTKGLKWKRSSDTLGNVHHMAGFWICAPLAMLSLTGAWIAFPEIAAKLSGKTAPSLAERMAQMRALPLAKTNFGVDLVIAHAQEELPGPLAFITWPTENDPTWKVGIKTDQKPATISVEDKTGKAMVGGGMQSGRIGQTLRRMHDGSGMWPAWQAMIFVAGLFPALLGFTGIVMWWRSRVWRANVARRSKDAKAQI
ncbi:MAG: PepSY-associated TM helix domain-containing protein [Sphingomonadaceae bacterium]